MDSPAARVPDSPRRILGAHAGAWARRELDLWWPLIEPELAAGPWARLAGVPDEPLFVQADLAQALMAAAAAPVASRTGAFATSRTSPAMRHVHLLDTIHRAPEQDLTLGEAARRLWRAAATPEVAQHRQHIAGLVAVAGGPATPEVAQHRQHILPCLEAFRDLGLRHRMLDAGLTWWAFGRFLLPRQ